MDDAVPTVAIRKTGLAAGLVAILVLATIALAHTATTGAAQQPRLRIERWSPATVTGADFRAHERVRVVLHHPGKTETRRTHTNANGSFSARFADVTLDRCSGYSITATGSSGSRARLVRRALPECPPA
jgi:hypothetical protein